MRGSAAGPSPGPTHDRATESRSRPTSARARHSTGRWRTSPRSTRTGTKPTTRSSRPPSTAASRRRSPGSELRPPLLEKAALGVRVNELQGTVVCGDRLLDAIGPAQQLRPGGVQGVVAVELETVDQRESGVWVTGLGDGGSPVQLHDR